MDFTGLTDFKKCFVLVGVQLMKKFAQVTGCDHALRMRGNFRRIFE
jgi:hypothetical protein